MSVGQICRQYGRLLQCSLLMTGLGLPAWGGEWTAVPNLSGEVAVGAGDVTARAVRPVPSRPRALPIPQLGRGPIVLAAGAPDLQLDERLEPRGGLTRPLGDPLSEAPGRPWTVPGPNRIPDEVVGSITDDGHAPRLAPPQNGSVRAVGPRTTASQGVDTFTDFSDDGNAVVEGFADPAAPWEDAGAYYPSEYCEGEIFGGPWCDDFASCGPTGSIWDMGLTRIGNLSINVGATGFQSALDLGRNSNFGFSEGFNWSMPITPQQFVSAQFGYRATQTNLTGTAFGSGSRQQHFMTAGVFLRNDFSRFQAGVVYDWWQEEFHRNIRMEQLRVELSVRTLGQHEFGFLGAKAMSQENDATLPALTLPNGTVNPAIPMRVKPLDYYTFFLRKNMVFGGIGTISGGTTHLGGGVFAAKYEIPISDRFYINSQFLMYIPKEGRGIGGQAKETWGIGIDLVWMLGRGAMSRQCNMSRPMFDVVDNTSLIPSLVW